MQYPTLGIWQTWVRITQISKLPSLTLVYSWYAVNGTCWFRDPSPSSQLRWLVGAQSVWMVLMSTVEIISFLIIVIFMMRHEVFFLIIIPLVLRAYSNSLGRQEYNISRQTPCLAALLPA